VCSAAAFQAEMAQAEKQYVQTQAQVRVFTEFFYETKKTWSRERRVIAKAEHLDKCANPRFVVTSLSPERSNQLRLYFSSIAYVLMQTLRPLPPRRPAFSYHLCKCSGFTACFQSRG
jgi:Transposase DDE domain group 1